MPFGLGIDRVDAGQGLLKRLPLPVLVWGYLEAFLLTQHDVVQLHFSPVDLSAPQNHIGSLFYSVLGLVPVNCILNRIVSLDLGFQVERSSRLFEVLFLKVNVSCQLLHLHRIIYHRAAVGLVHFASQALLESGVRTFGRSTTPTLGAGCLQNGCLLPLVLVYHILHVEDVEAMLLQDHL